MCNSLCRKHIPIRIISDFIDINYVTCNVVDAVIESSVQSFVFLSSIAVHSDCAESSPLNELSAYIPSSPYGYSKLLAESYILSRRDEFKSFCILRPPLIYGDSCPGNLKRIVKLLHMYPFLSVLRSNSSKSFISIENVVKAVEAVVFEPCSSNVFVISDPKSFLQSDLVDQISCGLGIKYPFSILLPDFFVLLVLLFTGSTSALFKYFGSSEVSSSRFQAQYPRAFVQSGLSLTPSLLRSLL